MVKYVLITAINLHKPLIQTLVLDHNSCCQIRCCWYSSAGSLKVTGIATLSSVSGFVNTKLTTSTQDMIVEAGNSGSVSGEVSKHRANNISINEQPQDKVEFKV